MDQTPAASPPNTVTSRIRAALNTLARHGVTEEQVRQRSRLSAELWERFAVGTDTVPANLEGIKLLELVALADALMLDTTYLLSGDRIHSIKYSPCGLHQLIASRYPGATAVQPSQEQQEFQL